MQNQTPPEIRATANAPATLATPARSLTFRYTEKDLANAMLLSNRLNIFSRKTFFFFITIAILATVLVAAIGSPSWLILAGIVPAYLALAYLVVLSIHYVYVPWYARRSFRQQKTLQVLANMSWSPEGFSIATEDGNASIPWGKYLRWAENDRIILLFLGPTLYHMIPKWAFSSQDDIDDLKQIIASSGLPLAKPFAKVRYA